MNTARTVLKCMKVSSSYKINYKRVLKRFISPTVICSIVICGSSNISGPRTGMIQVGVYINELISAFLILHQGLGKVNMCWIPSAEMRYGALIVTRHNKMQKTLFIMYICVLINALTIYRST